MGRRELREHIFKLLFRIEFNEKDEMPEQIQLYLESMEEAKEKEEKYITDKYKAIVKNKAEIDKVISEVAEGWKISRMGKVDLTILRLAVYEIKYDADVPKSVAINEAVEISKKFGGKDSSAFVNGILGKIEES